MNIMKEKVAYLQGMAAGMEIDKSTKEGKLVLALIDVLREVVEEMSSFRDQQLELEEYIEAIDEDLADVEDELYGEDEYPDEEDTNYIEVECPQCNDIVKFDSSILVNEELNEVKCPNCGAVVYVNNETLYEDDDEEEELED